MTSTTTALPHTPILLDTVEAVRSWLAEALFASSITLSNGTQPDPDAVRSAIRTTLRQLRSELVRDQVADEYGAYPETAPARMRACLNAVDAAYSPRLVARLRCGGAR
jgi:hypothetical protein